MRCIQTLPVGSTVYREILVTDSDAGMAGDVMVSCYNPSGTDEVFSLFSLIFFCYILYLFVTQRQHNYNKK